MINICNLSDIRPILISKKGNPEIVKIVRKYFNERDPVYYEIVKNCSAEVKTNANAKYFFKISLKEYEDIKYKIVVDIMNLVVDYYIGREKQFKNLKKVTDFVTYTKKDIKNFKK
ncbi:hypothetical protein LF65_05615 [Clostridium beijerinckii]|uniref:Uncharacterized protein n=1 Tax=Clostridium beijerinckii TaxID=1520 RepID=A0A0B5QVX8_CLOBE|nr:hypothetical protein [Clostridium beijerinckii]AJH02123.1 hypothetical protein LF65_05615 [Clostridium beijerinckii]